MTITANMISEGLTVGYVEIFGDKDSDKFFFNFNDKDYLVDDQYCMNPKCKCNEAILTFFEIKSHLNVQNVSFIIKLGLKGNGYQVIEQGGFSKKELEDIVDFFIKNRRETVKLLSNRYQEMKEKGKEILSKNKEKSQPQKNIENKIGRNELCTCGSGKKYKKCCGK